jgi:hypothetical protein
MGKREAMGEEEARAARECWSEAVSSVMVRVLEVGGCKGMKEELGAGVRKWRVVVSEGVGRGILFCDTYTM